MPPGSDVWDELSGPRRGVPLGSAALLLDYLGIDDPEDLDIEAIAQACHATIIYDVLEGSEARLIGANDRAIITINSTSPRARQRFSAAHELGHWAFDRGKIAVACGEMQLIGEWGQGNAERKANRFAADLLLPRKMFKRFSRHRPILWATVRELAERFQTSQTATAIRLVELGTFPAMAVCYDRGRLRWVIKSHLVPATLMPRRSMLQLAAVAQQGPHEVTADRFIDHPHAAQFRLVADSVTLTPDLSLSLLWWRDEAQIIAAASNSWRE